MSEHQQEAQATVKAEDVSGKLLWVDMPDSGTSTPVLVESVQDEDTLRVTSLKTFQLHELNTLKHRLHHATWREVQDFIRSELAYLEAEVNQKWHELHWKQAKLNYYRNGAERALERAAR